MDAQRNSNITSYFQPKDGEKGKSKDKADAPAKDDSGNVPALTSLTGEKGKGKRAISDSPPPDKRRDTKTTPSQTLTHLSSKDLPTNWLPTASTSSSPPSKPTLTLTTHKGDLFGSAPSGSLLIHACNTQGSWGAGIARAFRDRYPKAYTIYRHFCTKEHDPKTNTIPMGTALLIPPVDAGKKHWIGCVFTSAKYGKAKAKPEVIVSNTVPAVQMLLELAKQADGITEVRMCKINSGLFGVPWEKTVEALQGIEVREGWRGNVDVWEP